MLLNQVEEHRVVADEIRPAIEYLEGAARVTAEDLIREFGERWRG